MTVVPFRSPAIREASMIRRVKSWLSRVFARPGVNGRRADHLIAVAEQQRREAMRASGKAVAELRRLDVLARRR